MIILNFFGMCMCACVCVCVCVNFLEALMFSVLDLQFLNRSDPGKIPDPRGKGKN